MLRREGYRGAVTIISADDSPPCDRPNLSKDFLAGTAAADWIPLRPPKYYGERHIELELKSRVSSIDVNDCRVNLENGEHYEFGALLLATGADPVRLEIPGAADAFIHYLRTSPTTAQSYTRNGERSCRRRELIDLEVAASLRARGIAMSSARTV
jgi:NAD(P)H-nitrite reductase large subunit